MKKLIAVLVVFAIAAGAVFAQEGRWSLWSNGEIGTRLDFLPWQIDDLDIGVKNIGTAENPIWVHDKWENGKWLLNGNTKPVIIVGAAPYENYDHVSGKFGLSYSREGMGAGFDITQQDPLKAWVWFNNGVRSANFAMNLQQLLNGNYSAIEELTGSYNFLDGKLTVEATVRRGWQGAKWGTSDILPGDLFSVTQNDNYLLINTNNLVEGLSFGLFLPGMFDFGNSGWSNQGWQNGTDASLNNPSDYYDDDGSFDDPNKRGDNIGIGDNINNFQRSGDYNRWHTGRPGNRRFVEDTLEKMLLGVRYRTGPLGIGTEFQLLGRSWNEDKNRFNPDLRSRLYLGATYDINSQMRAEFDFRGQFHTDRDTRFWTNDPKINYNDFSHGTDPKKSDHFDDYTAVANTAFAALSFGGRFVYTDGPMQARLDLIYFDAIAQDTGRLGDKFAGGNQGGIVGWNHEDNDPTKPRTSPIWEFPGGNVENGVFRLRPYFRYDIVPTHLRFTLDTRFDISLGQYYLGAGFKPFEVNKGYSEPTSKDYISDDEWRGKQIALDERNARAHSLAFRIQPEFFFNMMGTGSGNWSNGIAFRYRIEGRVYGANAGPSTSLSDYHLNADVDSMTSEQRNDARNRLENDRFIWLKTNSVTRNSFDIVFKWNL